MADASADGQAPRSPSEGVRVFQKLFDVMQAEYEARSEADRAELREQFDVEVHRMRENWRAASADSTSGIPPRADVAPSEAPAGKAGAVAEALQQGLSQLIGKTEWPQLGETLRFDAAVATTLQEVIKGTTQLAEKAKEVLQQFKLRLAYSGIGGEESHVEVFPAAKTVEALKADLALQHGHVTRHAKLFPRGGTVEMRDPDLLSDYDLSGGISVVLCDGVAADPLLHFPFDEPEALARDAVSGRDGSLQSQERHLEPKEIVEDIGPVETPVRRGIMFRMYSKLRLDPPLQLEHEWTVSCWILSPHAPAEGIGRTRRIIAAGDGGTAFIALTPDGRFQSQEPGRGQPAVQDFNFNNLADGWHFVVVIGAAGTTRFFVDGNYVGRVDIQYKGRFVCIGNHQTLCMAPFGVLADLRVFRGVPKQPQYRV